MILGNSMAALAHRACKFLASCVVLAGACAVAQTGTPATPTPIQTTQSQTGTPGYVIKARVPLTILDIVVTDTKGKPVHGLKQTDFTILEDKQEVKPNSFEEHRSDDPPRQTRQSAPVFAQQITNPNTFSNATAPPGDRPINIFLLDSLNLPAQDQGMVAQQMLALLKSMPSGTPAAVMSLTSHLAILQGITTDTELLKAAIKKTLPIPSSVEDLFQDIANIEVGTTWDMVDREGEEAALRGQYALSGMRQLARYLAGMPGRKNLIWFTGLFPLDFPSFPDNVAFPPHPGELIRAQSYDLEPDLKSATDLLARAHVAVYPIDGRGLRPLPSPNGFRGKNLNYMNILEHGTMDDIAEQTGGKAFYNTNGLTEAAEAAIDTGSNFYTVTYTPLNQALDTRFRTISVKVDQPGLKLIYRDGYYAVDPATTLAGKQAQPQATAMQSAMLRGALEPTQILFQVKVAQAAGTEMTLPVSNKPDAKQMKPPYRHYSIAFLVDVNNIEFSQSIDGNYRGDFEFGVMVYNGNDGAVANTASKTVSPILPPAVYQSMRRGGANARLEIDVPTAGEYFLRIGVHDLISDRVGAVEIPVSSITPETAPAVAAGK
jgi:VWFA-related protein